MRSSYDRYGLTLEYIKYRSYIFSRLNLSSVTAFSPAFSVSSSSLPAFFLAFFTPPFRVFYKLLTVLRGCFTPKGLIHLSQCHALLSLSFLFLLSFLSPLFSFFPPFFSFSLSPCRFLVRRPPPCRTASGGPDEI